MTAVKTKILDDRLLEMLPAYATPGSAGIDLRACIATDITLAANATVMIPTGLAIHLDDPTMAAIAIPRSGLGSKHGIVLGNLVGLIDSDYQGEIGLMVWNRSSQEYTIKPMDRLAQLVIIPVVQVTFDIVDEFEATARGSGGFGSTGT